MTAKTLEQLEAAAQATERKHEAAQRAAEQARHQAEQDRQRRLNAYDRQRLDAFDDEQLGQDIRDAQRALDEAVASDPLGRAWVNLKVAQLRRAHLSGEMAAVASQLGDHRRITPRVAGDALFEEIGRAVDRVAESLVADELDARDAARHAAAEG
jgi:hypothetical protein